MRKRLLPALAILGVLALFVAAPVQAHQRYAQNTNALGLDPDPYDECWKTGGGTADVSAYQTTLGGNRQMSTNLNPLAWSTPWDQSAWFCVQDTNTDDGGCFGCVLGNKVSERGEDTGFLWVYAKPTGIGSGVWLRGESHCGAFGRSPTTIGSASLGTSGAYQGTQPRGVYVLQPDFCFAAASGQPGLAALDAPLNNASNTAWAALAVPACTSSTQATPCKDGPNEGIRIPVPLP